MRPIDADALIADLKYDIELDSRALDCMDLVGSERENLQFDKDCKQNTVDLLKRAPTIEPQQQWISCKKRPPEDDEIVIRRNLCDSCINNGCIFQSGIVRNHCDFYKADMRGEQDG